MNLQSLYYFIEVSKDLNMTATARRLYMSQQCLSGHIKRLEQHYGVQLFERKPRLTLTYEGEQLIGAATKILAIETGITDMFYDITKEKRGRIRLGISPARSRICVPMILPPFSKKHPTITIELHETPTIDMGEQVREGKLDFYIGINRKEIPDVDRTVLIRDRIYLVVSDSVLDHYYGKEAASLRQRSINGAHVKDFSRIPFLLHTSSNQLRYIEEMCFKEASFFPDVYVESNSSPTLFFLSQAGMGICFINQHILHEVRDKLLPQTNLFPLMLNNAPLFDPVEIMHQKLPYYPKYHLDFKRVTIEVFKNIEESRWHS